MQFCNIEPLYKIEKKIVESFRNSQKFIDLNYPIVPTDLVPEKQLKISVVTSCMSRLHDLKKTLPKNLEDNFDYENSEFVLLDYNSTDEVEKWVQDRMMDYIYSGKLVYYRTIQPSHFCPNHSRNLSFRLATGDLIVNVDTDNFMHKGFLNRLNQCASVQDENLMILPENFLQVGSKSLLLKGRFALYKKDIEMLRGFDEDLDGGYGFDDINFIFRGMLAGFRISRFESKYNEDRIETPMHKRYEFIDTKTLEEGHNNNVMITYNKITRKKISVNDVSWGAGKVVKNFSEEVVLV